VSKIQAKPVVPSAEELRQSEERFRLLVQSVKDYAIFLLDPEGNVSSWNEGAQRIKGWTADEIVGEHFSKFYPKVDRDNGKPEMLLRMAAAEGRFEDEGWRVRKDGSLFWADVVITALRDHKGELIGFVKVTRDFTERKLADHEIRLLNATLAQRNRELTAANEELEAFTYSVAHDLRAPLRHIYGFTKIIADDFGEGLPAEAGDYLNDILSDADRMGHMIDDLLSLTRVARQETRASEADLGEIVREAVRHLHGEAEGRKIEWRIGDLPTVVCDPILIRQAYRNLLSNAIKYTQPRETAVIEVGVMQRDGERVFFVRDNGVGFNMKYADKLFGVFQRMHRADEFEGMGVGLATVQRIVQKHGGRIWAEAEPDKGATFYFTLARLDVLPDAAVEQVPDIMEGIRLERRRRQQNEEVS